MHPIKKIPVHSTLKILNILPSYQILYLSNCTRETWSFNTTEELL
jgi:hypothetical protein